MLDPDGLNVWSDQRLVGHLWRNSQGLIGFRYEEEWLAQGEFSISHSLPLHQEDFCQALGFGHERKYQEDGGPTFADCYRLVQDVSTDPANDVQYLLRWQIFNVLAGNSDGHAKNLSLLYRSDGEVRLAPFYDLVCTRAIERIDYHLAFSVDDERNPNIVRLKHWDALAQQCGLRPRFLQDQVHNIASMLVEKLLPTRERFESLYGEYAALQRIERVVTKQCQRAIDG